MDSLVNLPLLTWGCLHLANVGPLLLYEVRWLNFETQSVLHQKDISYFLHVLCQSKLFQRLKLYYYLLCFQYSVSTPAFAFASFVFRCTLQTMAPMLGRLLVKWTSVNVISTKNAWVHITFLFHAFIRFVRFCWKS